MQIIKREADANGRFLAPGGYGFSIRPGEGATFPVTVRPNANPDAGILISDAGSLLMANRFGKLEVVDAPAGSSWEVTILEDMREWRTSQRSEARTWDTIFDKVFSGVAPAGSGFFALDASGEWNLAANANPTLVVATPFDLSKYASVVFTAHALAAGTITSWSAALMGRSEGSARSGGEAWQQCTAGTVAPGYSAGVGLGLGSSGTADYQTFVKFSASPVMTPFVVPFLQNGNAGAGVMGDFRATIMGLRA